MSASIANPATRAALLRHLLLVLLVLPPAPPASAAGPDGQPVEVGDLDLDALLDPRLAAASLHTERSSAAPASVFVLTRDELRAHGFETLAEALRTVPGLFTYSDGFYQYVGVRGTGLLADYTRRLLVLVDGHPLNDGLGIAENGLGRDFPVPLAAVERIEVVKGPVGGVYGPAAFLGVVNVVTRGAAEPGWQLATSGDVAQGGLVGGRIAAAGTGHTGAIDVTIAFEALQSNGYTWTYPDLLLADDRPAPPGGRVPGMDGSDAFKAFLRAEAQDVTLTGACAHWNRGLPSAPYSSNLLDRSNHEESLACFLQVGAELQLPTGGSLGLRVAYDHISYRDLLMYPPPEPGGRGGVGPWRDVGTDGWFSAEARGSQALTPELRLLAGLAGEAHQTLQRAQSDVIPPVTVDPGGGIGVGDIRKDFTTVSAYGLVAWDLTSSLTLHAGLNWYRHQLFGSRFTPRGSVVWRASAHDTLKAIHAEGFRAPSMAEAFFDDVTDNIPNPDVRPERTRTYELAWEHRRPSGLTVAASLFRSEFRDLIDFTTVPAPGVTNPNPSDPADFRQQARNVGAYTVNGAEAWAAIRLPAGLSAYGGVSLQRASGARVNFPTVTGNLAVSSASPWRPLRLSARAAVASPRETVREALLPGQSVRVPWLFRLDAAATLTVPGVDGLTVEVALLDLFDGSVLHPVPGDFSPISQMPESPRTLRLGLTYQH